MRIWSILLLLLLPVQASARQPNVIFILADDLGYSELGCYGNDFNETPSLDKLSEQGMRFTHAYAAAPVCSPYRASLLTGQHPARLGILDYLRPNSAFALSPAHTTLPATFQANGYATGFIGKWHLTGYKYHNSEFEIRPTDVGFDSEIGGEVKSVGNGANFWPYVFRDQPVRWLDLKENRLGENEYLVDRMNHEAVEFIEQNQDRPFFLYLSHYAPHSILNGRPDKVKKYIAKHPPGPSTRTRCYLCQDSGHQGDPWHHWAKHHNPHLAAMLESIDEGVGLIMDKLNELDLAEDTILIFSSDNGGETNVTSNAPLRGGKSQLYEGGIRVPLIVRWPGKVPAGAATNAPTTSTDFFPTLIDACHLQLDPNHTFDGANVLGDWRGTKQRKGPRDLHWHYPLEKPHFLGGVSAGAIRSGNWKLVEFFATGKRELYHLATDPGESSNVAKLHPEMVEKLNTRLVQWRERVGARTCSTLRMTRSGNAIFQDTFSPQLVSSRWWPTEDYTVKNGILTRTDHSPHEARIFLQKPEYKNVVVKFDFQFQGTKDIRLLTGTPGKYNAVVHIQPDRFFIQTAVDQSVPFFPAIHGICAFNFQTDRWYTMTVEIAEDEVLAHIDQQHFVHAQHPIIDRTRTYFAFQTGSPGAILDNVQILQAFPLKEWKDQREHYVTLQKQHPLPEMPLTEKWKMLKENTHDLLYRTDPDYKSIVRQLAAAKARQHEHFPQVFSTIKEVRKPLLERKQQLASENQQYQRLNKQINQARQSQKQFVLARFPELESLPAIEFDAAFAEARQQVVKDDAFIALQKRQATAEAELTNAFPELFISNEEILTRQNEQRARLQNNPDFQKLILEVSNLVKTEREYRHQKNAELQTLWNQLFNK